MTIDISISINNFCIENDNSYIFSINLVAWMRHDGLAELGARTGHK